LQIRHSAGGQQRQAGKPEDNLNGKKDAHSLSIGAKEEESACPQPYLKARPGLFPPRPWRQGSMLRSPPSKAMLNRGEDLGIAAHLRTRAVAHAVRSAKR